MTDVDSLPCPECGRPLGEHTMAEYRAHTAHTLDFEAVPNGRFEAPGDIPITDHVNVFASVLEVDLENGTKVVLPAIQFNFESSNSGPVPPVIWTSDQPNGFKDFRKLVAGACDLAPMRAKQRLDEIRRAN